MTLRRAISSLTTKGNPFGSTSDGANVGKPYDGFSEGLVDGFGEAEGAIEGIEDAEGVIDGVDDSDGAKELDGTNDGDAECDGAGVMVGKMDGAMLGELVAPVGGASASVSSVITNEEEACV